MPCSHYRLYLAHIFAVAGLWLLSAGVSTAQNRADPDAGKTGPPTAKEKKTASGRRGEEPKPVTEQETIKRLMEGIKRLQKEGKLAESDRQAADLAARNPGSAA